MTAAAVVSYKGQVSKEKRDEGFTGGHLRKNVVGEKKSGEWKVGLGLGSRF